MDKLPRYELMITLNSHLSVGSGDSIAGVIDQEITHEHGIPVIPAKRLKGALRGVAKELIDWGITTEKEVNQLFGQIGQKQMAGFKMYDATLYQLPKDYFGEDSFTIEDYNRFSQQVRKYSERELMQLFTTLYTKTATLDGMAETGSLRTIRVINKGLVFKSILELEDKEDMVLLENCVKGLRHLGLLRTRGLGEVTCQLKKVATNKEHPPQVIEGKKAFRITLQQPTLLAGEKGLYYSCTNYIPGSALLGVFASLYIKKKRLGENAHLDEDFERIFLRNSVHFGYAYPEVANKKFIPCPAHIQHVKNGDRALYETLNTEGEILRKIGLFVHKERIHLKLHEPKQEFRMHHSRPKDRQYGRAINDTQTDTEPLGDKGQFYYYTALQKDQQFVGEFQGDVEDVELLLKLLNETNRNIQLGRSRTAEYGAAKVEILDQLPSSGFERADSIDQTVAIYLATPLTMQNCEGRYVADANLLIKHFEFALGVKLEVKKMYLQQTTLSGYNAKWGLPKQERMALDAGTVLIVSSSKEVDWTKLTKRKWGGEIGQGCGEIEVLKMPKEQESLECLPVETEIETVGEGEENLIEMIQLEINRAGERRHIRVKAWELAEEKINSFAEYSNSKVYQLEAYLLHKSKPNLSEEYIKKAKTLRTKVKEKLGDTFQEDGELLEYFIKLFFHMIKLEVRKNAQK